MPPAMWVWPRSGRQKPYHPNVQASSVANARRPSAVQGETGKMSASDPTSAIFVTDSAKQIKDKINKYAFSGGQDTRELQLKHGTPCFIGVTEKPPLWAHLPGH